MLPSIYAFGDRSFSVTSGAHGDAATLMLQGEFDMAGEAPFRAALETMERTGACTVFIDLRGLAFIDLTGLRMLVHAHRRAVRQHRRMVLVRGRPQVRRILTVCGLADRFEMVDAPERLGRLGSPAA